MLELEVLYSERHIALVHGQSAVMHHQRGGRRGEYMPIRNVGTYSPPADRGTPPFERCDSTLRLAEDLGVGTRDLKRIEVLGTPIAQACFNFRRV